MHKRSQSYIVIGLLCSTMINFCSTSMTTTNSLFLIMPGMSHEGFNQFLAHQKEDGPLDQKYDPFFDTIRGSSHGKIINLLPRFMDIGQKNCQDFFENEALKFLAPQTDSHYSNIYFLGGSQGSVPLFWFIHKYANDPTIIGKIKGIVVEGFVASANAAIFHAFKNRMSSKIANLPFAYYWVPYLMKIDYPFYMPHGSQVIHLGKIIGKIKSLHDKPIIFIHDVNDAIVPIELTRAMYYALKSGGHPNVYYIETNNRPLYLPSHVNLLFSHSHPQQIKALKHILNPYLNTQDNFVDLTVYQPDHTHPQFKKAYFDLVAKEMPFSSRKFQIAIKALSLSSKISLLCMILYKTGIIHFLSQLAKAIRQDSI